MRQEHSHLFCPCGSEIHYENCCGQYIDTPLFAPTPEALMRSRYTAFTQANTDYLVKTSDGKAKELFDANNSKSWTEQIEWKKLTIIDAPAVKPNDNMGYVEFIAEFTENGEDCMVHERSHFKKKNNAWYYTDGILLAEEGHCHDERCMHNHGHHDEPPKQPVTRIKVGR